MENRTYKILEPINNIELAENNLCHIRYELSSESRSFFRIARESHQLLYRFMIEALRGGANIAVTGFPESDKTRTHRYQLGSSPTMEIHKQPVECCKVAWRFSEPALCPDIIQDPPDGSIPEIPNRTRLIPFFDALAMIQTDCFMSRNILSRPIKVEDEEMVLMDWLHREIRNNYEHFVPRTLMSPILDLLKASNACISISKKLLANRASIMIYEDGLKDKIQNHLNQIDENIDELSLHYEADKKKAQEEQKVKK